MLLTPQNEGQHAPVQLLHLQHHFGVDRRLPPVPRMAHTAATAAPAAAAAAAATNATTDASAPAGVLAVAAAEYLSLAEETRHEELEDGPEIAHVVLDGRACGESKGANETNEADRC
jgi:hypothetical protein